MIIFKTGIFILKTTKFPNDRFQKTLQQTFDCTSLLGCHYLISRYIDFYDEYSRNLLLRIRT